MSRPVFIIGSPRSGTSVLTWSLGQHPNLYPLEETVWMGGFARSAQKSFELGSSRGDLSQISAMGITRERFFRGLGEAIDGMILEHRVWPTNPVAESAGFARARRPGDPKQRWVDGTPENSFYVAELLSLFPDAVFIHLLRDPLPVVRSLGNFAKIGGLSRSPNDGVRVWMRNVRACADAERSLPAHRITRLLHKELAGSPTTAVARCLAFVGESWCDECLKPLAQRINSSAAPAGTATGLDIDPELQAELRDLCAELGLDVPRADADQTEVAA